MYKEDSALNNLQRLICHKIEPNQTKANHTKSNIDRTMCKKNLKNNFTKKCKYEHIYIYIYIYIYM